MTSIPAFRSCGRLILQVGQALSLWCCLYCLSCSAAHARCDVAGFEAERQVEGLFVKPGILAAPASSNQGRTQNVIYLLVQGQGILIDPGPSGGAVGSILDGRDKGCPMDAVVNSHPHPENVLGNHAVPSQVPILSSPAVVAVMTERCPGCRSRFQSQLGLAADRDELIRLPMAFDAASGHAQTGWPGSLLWMDMGAAHSAADVALFERGSGLLLTGALAQCRVLPELTEGDIRQWIASLRRLEAVRARWFIGSQGRLCEIGDLVLTRQYLEQLLLRVQEDVHALGDPATADQRLDLPAFSGWALYADRHGLNVQRLYRLLELEAQQPARR